MDSEGSQKKRAMEVEPSNTQEGIQSSSSVLD